MTDKESDSVKPVESNTKAEEMREKLSELDITESDIADAVAWARRELRAEE